MISEKHIRTLLGAVLLVVLLIPAASAAAETISVQSGTLTLPADVVTSGTSVTVDANSLVGVLYTGLPHAVFFKGGNQGMYFNLDSFDGHTHKAPSKEDQWHLSLDGKEVTEPDWSAVHVSDGQTIFLVFDEKSTGKTYEYTYTVSGGGTASWSVTLINGDTKKVLSQSEFETIAAKYGKYTVTDAAGDWKGVPLYVLAGIVDDADENTFNTRLAETGYSIRVTDSQTDSPFSINFDSGVIANNNEIIAANTLNGAAVPQTIGEKQKPCYPLQMRGVSGGQQIGNIATIELIDVPAGTNILFLSGKMERYLTLEEFEASNHHFQTENGYTGMPLYTLVAVIDDVEAGTPGTYAGGHFTLNTDIIKNTPYTIVVTSSDGTTMEIPVQEIVGGKESASLYIIARLNDGSMVLTGTKVQTPFKNVKSVSLAGPAYQGDDWYILLNGPQFGIYMNASEFRAAADCEWHTKSFTDPYTRDVWSGVTLATLVGYVDDMTIPMSANHGGSFNLQLAQTGYKIIITAADGYSAEISSTDMAGNKNGYLIADTLNGNHLSGKNSPLRLVGSAAYLDTGSKDTSKFTSVAVGGLVKIELKEFQDASSLPKITVEKLDGSGAVVSSKIIYWADIIADSKTYPVIGGESGTRYSFQGLVYEEDGEKLGEGLGWDLDEKYVDGNYKVSEVVKGTAIKNLSDAVGGMNESDEIRFICSLDGWTTVLEYDNIYNPPARMGTAFLAWYSNGKTVPDYSQGPRLFFTSDDNVFSHADMYYTIDEAHWHYNSGRASAGGISAQMVDLIQIAPKSDGWQLKLTGAINESIDKGYFENGLTCTFANGTESDHQAYYTDASGNVFGGMPLWILTGFVDDENYHTGKSYNRELAQSGYTISVISGDGKSVEISSKDAFMNAGYIIANTRNAQLISPDDGGALILTGSAVSKPLTNITEIKLNLKSAKSPSFGIILLAAGLIAAVLLAGRRRE